MMSEIYKKCDAKNKSFAKLSESFEMSFFAFFPLEAAVHRCSTRRSWYINADFLNLPISSSSDENNLLKISD